VSRYLASGVATLLLAAACSFGSCGAQPAVGDGCLVGNWTELHEENRSAYSYAGQAIAVSGSAGTRLTIAGDGTETFSFDSSAPLVGSTGAGQQLAITVRGTVKFHVHGDGHELTETGTRTTVPTQATLDGNPVQYSGYEAPGSWRYTCGDKTLTMTTDDGVQTDTWSRA